MPCKVPILNVGSPLAVQFLFQIGYDVQEHNIGQTKRFLETDDGIFQKLP